MKSGYIHYKVRASFNDGRESQQGGFWEAKPITMRKMNNRLRYWSKIFRDAALVSIVRADCLEEN